MMKKILAMLLVLQLTGCMVVPVYSSHDPQRVGRYSNAQPQDPEWYGPGQGVVQPQYKIVPKYGMIAGGVVGGLIGHQMGHGKGKTAMTILGTILGTEIGGNQ